ncbi:MAG TPA: MATE family efflux transporter, partial [Geminicoccaceae bacterium]|nr:MATE family efflux transporter [Geminicoccaceae bacterium]
MTAHREAWRLAWPLILSNLSLPLLGAVDTAVVGHLPEPHHLGAVAIGALIFNVLFFAFGFLRMGTTGLTAQAFGAGHGGELRAGLARALLLAEAAALLLLLAGDAVLAAAEAAFAPSPAVMAGLESYVRTRLFGAPAALAQMVLLGWLLGMQNARGPLLLLVVTNGLNAALDVWFVFGLGWGVAGVARAAVCAEYGGLAVGLWLTRRELARIAGAWSLAALRDAAALRRLMAVNRDIFLRSLAIESAYLTFTALGSRQGEVVLAANAVLLNFQLFTAYGLDGFAHAAEAMVGRHLGARDRAGFRAATRANVHWALGLAALMT